MSLAATATTVTTTTSEPDLGPPSLGGNPRRSPWRFAPVVIAVWMVVVAAASVLHPSGAVHRTALFVHLVGVTAGFGAVLVIDLHGILWLTGRRRLGDVIQLTRTLHPVIWSALAALTLSGMFLEPNILLPRTGIKLALVLAAGLNGLWANRLSREFDIQPPDARAETLDRRLLRRVILSGAISQVAWWGATLIGFLVTSSRHP